MNAIEHSKFRLPFFTHPVQLLYRTIEMLNLLLAIILAKKGKTCRGWGDYSTYIFRVRVESYPFVKNQEHQISKNTQQEKDLATKYRAVRYYHLQYIYML